ncbi:response regulator transcription factor [Pseudanabaenaceae cyanobacterium LEGE 13415]|nr:response regulator transcription factor [Pseudanabaenaceae cyanobacterium LEGE 13415]
MVTRTGSKQLSILLVDDDQRFRSGLRSLLEFYQSQGGEIKVIGEASNVETALSLLMQRQPDLMLLDMELGKSDGMSVLRQMREQSIAVKPLVLSGHQEDHWIYQAMQAGALGYVFKPQVTQQLWEAITTVLKGEIYLPREAATSFFRQFQSAQVAGIPDQYNDCELSHREIEVLCWLVRGASNEQIAQQLHVSVATVKANLTVIFQKLQVTNRTHAIVEAMKRGLVQP